MKNPRVALAVAAAFAAGVVSASAVTAFSQRALSINDVLGDPSRVWGKNVTVDGIAGSVRYSLKTVDYKTRQQEEYVSFSLYAPDPKGYKGRGKYYISVNIPAASFGMNKPAEDRVVALTGQLQPPFQLGRIE